MTSTDRELELRELEDSARRNSILLYDNEIVENILEEALITDNYGTLLISFSIRDCWKIRKFKSGSFVSLILVAILLGV